MFSAVSVLQARLVCATARAYELEAYLARLRGRRLPQVPVRLVNASYIPHAERLLVALPGTPYPPNTTKEQRRARGDWLRDVAYIEQDPAKPKHARYPGQALSVGGQTVLREGAVILEATKAYVRLLVVERVDSEPAGEAAIEPPEVGATPRLGILRERAVAWRAGAPGTDPHAWVDQLASAIDEALIERGWVPPAVRRRKAKARRTRARAAAAAEAALAEAIAKSASDPRLLQAPADST